MSRTRVCRTVSAGLVTAALVLVSACTGSDESETNKVVVPSSEDDPSYDAVPGTDVVVESSATEVTLEVDQRLIIDFHTYNSSVGDEFQVTTEPDPTVLADFREVSKYLGADDEDGASSALHFEGVAAEPGTTEITIEYFYRGEKSSKRADTHLAVEVVSP